MDSEGLTLKECCKRWSISSVTTVKARARALDVELLRVSNVRTIWPRDDVPLGDAMHAHLKTGGTMSDFLSGVRLIDFIDHLPLSRSSVYELIKVLGIETGKGASSDGKGRVAWLASADARRLSDAAEKVHLGQMRIGDFGRKPGTEIHGSTVLGMDLRNVTLPDAITRMVEAWLDAQEV